MDAGHQGSSSESQGWIIPRRYPGWSFPLQEAPLQHHCRPDLHTGCAGELTTPRPSSPLTHSCLAGKKCLCVLGEAASWFCPLSLRLLPSTTPITAGWRPGQGPGVC